jgi:hypothetical protein
LLQFPENPKPSSLRRAVDAAEARTSAAFEQLHDAAVLDFHREAYRQMHALPELKSTSLFLLTQDAEIVLGVLIEIFSLDDVTARSGIAR